MAVKDYEQCLDSYEWSVHLLDPDENKRISLGPGHGKRRLTLCGVPILRILKKKVNTRPGDVIEDRPLDTYERRPRCESCWEEARNGPDTD